MKNNLRKYKFVIIGLLSFIILCLIALIINFIISKNNYKEISNNNFSISYDNNWKIKNKEDSIIELKRQNKALLKIECLNISDDYKYEDIYALKDDIINHLEKENANYKLIAQEEKSITKDNYNGYQVLFENSDKQVLIRLFKSNYKLYTITYEADNKYFDLILDSVNNIVYNLKIKNEEYDLSKKINLNPTKIKFNENSEVDKKIKKVKTEEISSNNYTVIYNLPTSFKLSTLDSTFDNYNFEGLENNKTINLNVSILNRNIYEYLDKNSTKSIYTLTSVYKDYADFKEEIEEYNKDKYNGYIYRVTYKLNTYKYESVYLVLEINKNHIFVANFSSTNVEIPRNLIEKIKIKSVLNYANVPKQIIEDNFLVANFQRYLENKKIENIKLKSPNNYTEINYDSNMYQYRYYGLDYNEKEDNYKYSISYYLSSYYSTKDNAINNINSKYHSFKEYKELSDTQEITLNNKVFESYDGSYLDATNTLKYEKLLIYNLENGGYLQILINTSNVNIEEKVLNEITNFDIIE